MYKGEATLKRVVYSGRDNARKSDWHVLGFGGFKAVGSTDLDLYPHESYYIEGMPETDKNYGDQLSFTCLLPVDQARGILEQFISVHNQKTGVKLPTDFGQHFAMHVYEQAVNKGLDSYPKVMPEVLEKLQQIYGKEKGIALLQAIGTYPFTNYGHNYALLTKLGVHSEIAKKIVQNLPTDYTLSESNIYDIHYFDLMQFSYLDKLIRNYNTNPTARIAAAFDSVVKQTIESEGHIWMDMYEIHQRFKRLFPELYRHLGEVKKFKRVHINGNKVYFNGSHLWERTICERFFNQKCNSFNADTGNKELDQYLNSDESFIITGGAGVGKTHAIKTICDTVPADILLMAPTGKAAAVLRDRVMNVEANTIHHKLGWDGVTFHYSDESFDRYDLCIIDEASMVDSELLYHVCQALAPETKIILVGDKNQLLPMGQGSPFFDMVNSGYPTGIELKKSHRTDVSEILSLMHGVEAREHFDPIEYTQNVVTIPADNPGHILSEIHKIIKSELDEGYEPGKFVLISPTKKRELGTYNLNGILQNILNPDGQQTLLQDIGENHIRIGDPLMNLRNYHNVSNGDVGIVIDSSNDSVFVEFSFMEKPIQFVKTDEEVPYNLKYTSLAYSSTVHKMQGDQAEVIIILFPDNSYGMFSNNLIYTAIGRAIKKVYFVTLPGLINDCIRTEIKLKNTDLKVHLKQLVIDRDKDRHINL
jgi:hypothetical protein